MASEPKRSNDFRFNFDLVMAGIARWPITTLILMLLVSVLSAFQPDASLRPDGMPLSASNKALLVASTLLSILSLKGLMFLMIYPRLHKASFPGSYLISSFIVFAPFFLGFAAFLNALAGDNFPVAGRIVFALFSYVITSLFFAGALRMQHGMLALTEPLDAYVRKKWEEVVGRRKPPE